MVELKPQHRWARLLGFAGIAPMLAATATLPHPLAVDVMRLYGLAIVAFLCGNAWTVGLMTRRATSAMRIAVLVVSNIGVLLAVAAAVWLPPAATFVVTALLFAGLLALDLSLPAFSRQPAYYRRMRIVISTVVVLTYAVAAVRVWY